MVTPNFLSDFDNPCQDLLFPRSYQPRKNISVLAGTTVKRFKFLAPSRDAQNVCAVANGGTVLDTRILPCMKYCTANHIISRLFQVIYLFRIPQKLKQFPGLAQVPNLGRGSLFQSFPVLQHLFASFAYQVRINVLLLYELVSRLLQSLDLLFVGCEGFFKVALIFQQRLYCVKTVARFFCL